MANRNFISTNSNKEFGELAKKLRMERFDPDELAFYKQTALQGEKLRNRKKKMATRTGRAKEGKTYRVTTTNGTNESIELFVQY